MIAKKTTAHTASQTYTVKQACAVLGIKSSKFYTLVQAGELETFYNGRRYVTAQAITKYQDHQVKLERERREARALSKR
jgi:excisionase family DNA binding protein